MVPLVLQGLRGFGGCIGKRKYSQYIFGFARDRTRRKGNQTSFQMLREGQPASLTRYVCTSVLMSRVKRGETERFLVTIVAEK